MEKVLSLLLLCLRAPAPLGFNLDVVNPSVFTGPRRSYFGYSVDFHSATDPGVNVLIGAPRANASSDWSLSSSVVRRGAVFGCPWRGDSSCQEIPFDTEDNRRSDVGNQMEFKSDQWFGATVRSNGHHILACAPMYEWSTISQTDREPVGSCFIKTPTKTVEYAPCRTASSRPEGQGFCQAGFTADLVQNNRVVLGGPGSYYWQGQLISDELPEILSDSSRQFVKSYRSQRSTGPAGAQYDDSYLGYAVAVGDFNNDGVEDYVTGVPRGEKALGYVTILNGTNMEAMVNLTGSQIAAYFGHSVAATDINNDGLTDILVGAPLYMESRSDGKLAEVGQLYVYLGSGPFSFLPPLVLIGWEAYGRFGFCITALGDLDMDGFHDVAVSAPYAGQHHRGMVYIYNGSPLGLEPTPSQALEGRWASSYMAPSFGFSLRGNTDIDGNGYPDLLVGALGADRAVLYRSRPVVSLNVSLELRPQVIDPQQRGCTLGTGYSVSCFTVIYCLQASGRRIPAQLTVALHLMLDAGRRQGVEPRVLLLHSQSDEYRKQMLVRTGDRASCEELQLYLRGDSEFRDKVSPISVRLAFSLEERKGLSPVLHHHTPTNISKQVHLLLDCGDDNICSPDLHLTVRNDREVLYFGEDLGVLLLVEAENRGEAAYEAELHVTLPTHAHFIGGVRNQSLSKLPCVYQRVNLTRLVVCDLGNPMRRGTKLVTALKFSVHQLSDQDTEISFRLQIVSSNRFGGRSQTVHSETRLAALSNVQLRGVSAPDQVFLPIANWSPRQPPQEPSHIGPLLQHIYELANDGPSVFSKALMDIYIPYRHGNTSLLYITHLETDGPISCVSLPPLDFFKLPGGGVSGDSSHGNHSMVAGSNQDDGGQSHSVLDNRRHRRDLEEEAGVLGCEAGGCLQVKCLVGRMERGMRANLFLHSRLDVASLLQPPKANRSFILRSEVNFQVIQMPYKVPAPLPANITMVSTSVLWLRPSVSPSVPVWAVVLAVMAGLLLLLLLCYAMAKAGYFNRMRPPLISDGTEHEQLQPQNGDVSSDT